MYLNFWPFINYKFKSNFRQDSSRTWLSTDNSEHAAGIRTLRAFLKKNENSEFQRKMQKKCKKHLTLYLTIRFRMYLVLFRKA